MRFCGEGNRGGFVVGGGEVVEVKGAVPRGGYEESLNSGSR
jgi:hypothetical protein